MKFKKILFSLFIILVSVSSLAQEQLKVGEIAPNFNGLDQMNTNFDLKDALKQGPVIVSFYRGSWCPYCTKQLKEYQARYSEITDKKAQIIVITPDLESGVKKTVKLIQPDFKIIRDKDLKISHALKVISEEKFMSFEGDLGNGRKFLPVPATYVIGQDGKIKYSYFDANYKIRAILDEVIESLDK